MNEVWCTCSHHTKFHNSTWRACTGYDRHGGPCPCEGFKADSDEGYVFTTATKGED